MDKTIHIENQSVRIKSTWAVKSSLVALTKASDHAQSIRACESYTIEAEILGYKRAIKHALDAGAKILQLLVEGPAARCLVLAVLLCCHPAAAQSKYFNDYMASGQAGSYRSSEAPAWGPANPYPPAPPPAGSGWGAGDSAFSAGALPHYRYPRMLSDPGIHGPTVFLMPDGGTWTINPPAIDGFLPPPIYTPPDRDDYYRHHRRGRRF